MRIISLALFILILLFGCKEQITESPELTLEDQVFFSGYVTSFPSGVKSKAASFKVGLTNAIEGLDITEVPDQTILAIQPKIKGNLSWIDNRTLVFTPDDVLQSDQRYQFRLDLKKIYPDIPSDKSVFTFDISTRKSEIYQYEPSLFPYDAQDPSKQHIEGRLRVSDITNIEELKNCLSAKQNNKDLSVEWIVGSDDLEFLYTIQDVVRSKMEDLVTIQINGDPIGSKTKETIEVIIPALGVFEVATIETLGRNDQQIDIHFSDFLDEDQNLEGLVRLSNGAKIRTTIARNTIKIYPANRQVGELNVIIDKSIQNALGERLKDDLSYTLSFSKLTPQIARLSSGVIMPSTKRGLVFPFKAVSLHAVQVSVIRVFEDNIGQFLQVNSLDQSDEIKRVGRLVHKSNIVLGDPTDKSLQSWRDYAIDLSQLMKTEPGALYRIKISFTKNHTVRDCGDDIFEDLNSIDLETDSEYQAYDEFNRYYGDDEYYSSSWLKDKDDPCDDSYYESGNPNSLPIFQNVMASDIGIIAKRSRNDQLFVALTDLKSTKSLSGKTVKLYNLQNREIQSGISDKNGFIDFDLIGQPLYLIAEDGAQKGYLKLDDGSSLSLSTFDVSGGRTQKGMKGFLYQERGVSRPGDSLYITFILEDHDNPLPQDHPVTFELYDPKNQRTERKVISKGVNNFYTYRTATNHNAPTGNWNVKTSVGGVSFNKTIKIETVKPNRLKINLDFEGDVLMTDNLQPATLEVKWLHGAVAKNLKADVEMALQPTTTKFKGFDDYHFDDVSKDFESDVKKIFDAKLDENGQAIVSPKTTVKDQAPGMLRASFKIRAFEEGGNFSVDRFSKNISPYQSYVGVKLPKGPGWNDAIFSDEDSRFEIVTVDQKGNPVSRNNLKVEIFNLRWSWWWERSSSNNIRNYVSNRSENLMQSKVISTNDNGKGYFDFNLDMERYGRTLIRITDPISGHSTSNIFYTTYSRWWDDGGSDEIAGAAEMLTFKTDKTDYNVGETINIELPNSNSGRALISVENGTAILEKFWVDLSTTDGKIALPSTTEMAPNAYLNISYIQPHGQVDNDRPIRLYGIQRVNITDQKTKIEPVLKAPKEIKPESDFELSVKERNGQRMTYTIAVVDDGLLDLTRFKTPEPWNTFYAREALGVKTWDLYSDVMGAYGGTLTRMLALGGDEFAEAKEPEKANRFKPVVKFIGPFELAAGKSAKHILTMPNYVGSVRAMVVAANPANRSYGHTDATIPVKKPLMVVTTLPRVLSPTESLEVPITVFAMDKKVTDVNVKIESNELLDFEVTSKRVRFTEIGDQVVHFPLKVADAIGIGKIKVTVTGAGETATEEIEIDIRLPNPSVTTVQEGLLAAKDSKKMNYEYFGVSGTNEGILELSTMPPLNLEKRLKYLIQYPHGCVEQTTSAAFPQLYLEDVSDMTNAQKDNARKNIENAIKRLKRFQTANGGFSYWPGERSVSKWGTTYAGHFILEAITKGYKIPYGMKDQLIKYLSNTARNWSDDENQYWGSQSSRLDQAYRLYILARADKPELGAMNRLRGINNLENIVKWKLAGAYALAGKPEFARELIASAKKDIKPYNELSYTYGSHVRDKAIILETLTLLNNRSQAMSMIKEISTDIGSNNWYSTQTTAYSLMAISKFMEGQDNDAPIDVNLSFGNGPNSEFQMIKPLKRIALPNEMNEQSITISSNGGKELFARIILSGTPKIGNEKAYSSNISLKTRYTDLSGKTIGLDQITQGSDINIEVTVSHLGNLTNNFQEMALTQIIPAGWEIRNTRLDQINSSNSSLYDYQDVRDDRVLTYFDLSVRTTKTFTLQINAAYAGRYYLPAIQCEAMYDNTITASTKGQWINILPD